MQRTFLHKALAAKMVLFLFCLQGILAQQTMEVPATAGSAHGIKGSHRLTLGLGHAHLSQGRVEGRTAWVPVASWSLNYDYWLSNKWAIGLQNDLILETFIIEHGDNEELERNKPIAIVPVGIFKFAPHWSVLGGVGAEYSEGHTLALTRIGMEFGWHLPKNWEAGIAAVWDNRWNYYNAWVLSFTFSKIWPHHKLTQVK
jgi:hypothetical protein